MDLAIWETMAAATATELAQRAAAFLPNVLSAVGLVLLGWGVAWVARSVATRLLTGVLAFVSRQRTFGRVLERGAIGTGFVRLSAGVLYWLILALFVAAAVERLDLQIAAGLVSSLAAYLPRVLLGLAIAFAALIGGQIAHSAVSRAAAAAGLAQATLLGRATQALIAFLGIVTAADQIGIQSTLLTVVVATAVGATLGGATLAFGLGSGLAVSNIISIFYVLKTYRVGQIVRIGPVQGEILEITQTGVVIAAPEGRVLVPGRRFSEEASVLLTGGRA